MAEGKQHDSGVTRVSLFASPDGTRDQGSADDLVYERASVGVTGRSDSPHRDAGMPGQQVRGGMETTINLELLNFLKTADTASTWFRRRGGEAVACIEYASMSTARRESRAGAQECELCVRSDHNYVTVKDVALDAVPPGVVTTILPVFAPVGTVAVI